MSLEGVDGEENLSILCVYVYVYMCLFLPVW